MNKTNLLIILLMLPTVNAYTNGLPAEEYTELIVDAPYRLEAGQESIPILVFVNDADGVQDHLTHIEKLDIFLDYPINPHLKRIEYEKTITNSETVLPYPDAWYEIINLPLEGVDEDGDEYHLSDYSKINLISVLTGWEEGVECDDTGCSPYNLSFTREFPLDVNLNDEYPKFENYYCGDTHYHSEYTDNSVEFGGQIDQTKKTGKAMGLDWTFITDHSFDLNDEKWWVEKTDIDLTTSNEFVMIQGEEVSCRAAFNILNLIGADVYSHYLAYNTNQRIPGGEWEDSLTGEIGYKCKDLPALVNSMNNQKAFGYVAHPLDGDEHELFEGDYFRTYWREWDTPYAGLEIWNGWDNGSFNEVERGFKK